MSNFNNELKKHWLPICVAKNLKKKPISISVLGKKIVLFRNKNGVAALTDRCPHRNVPLSSGTIINENIRCPYHGWEFNGKGQCTSIPSASPELACKYTSKSYSTQELEGLIWINLNESSKHSSPIIPAHISDGNYNTRLWHFSSKGTLLNTLENFLDGTHTHHVHTGIIRTDKKRSAITTEVIFKDSKLTALYKNEPKQSGLIAKFFEPFRSESRAHFQLPSIATLEYLDQKSAYFTMSAYIVPIEENRMQIFAFLSHRKSLIPGIIKHSVIYPFFKTVLNQDQKILETQSQCIKDFGQEQFIVTDQDIMRPYMQKMLLGSDISSQKIELKIIYL